MKYTLQSFTSFFFVFYSKTRVSPSEAKHCNDREQPQIYTCTECWCLPSTGPEGNCPELDRRRITYDDYTVEMFKSFRLTLTPWEDLPHLIPDDGGDVYDNTSSSSYGGVYQPVCSPYPYLSKLLGLPLCQQPPDFGYEAVCGFLYEDNDDSCAYGRHYGMKTFKNWKKARDAGAIVTHTGACGVCSNANDLAVNLLTDIDSKSFQCSKRLLQLSSSAIDDVYVCFSETIGFTSECAWLWTSDAISTFQTCMEPCLENIGQPSNDPVSCALNSCLLCDEETSGQIFKLFSGRTRRNSGVITPVVRECSSIANIRQDPCASTSHSTFREEKKQLKSPKLRDSLLYLIKTFANHVYPEFFTYLSLF